MGNWLADHPAYRPLGLMVTIGLACAGAAWAVKGSIDSNKFDRLGEEVARLKAKPEDGDGTPALASRLRELELENQRLKEQLISKEPSKANGPNPVHAVEEKKVRDSLRSLAGDIDPLNLSDIT